MGTLKLQSVASTTIGTASGTLANAASVKIGTLDNTSFLCPLWDFQLATGFSSAPTPGVGIVVSVYAVPICDGSNSGSINLTGPVFPSSCFVGNFEVSLSQTATQYLTLPGYSLNALKYDFYVFNQSGQTMATAFVLTGAPSDWQY